jgi:alkanesulfonate monooxygenase SsuD/methylene tetrahydromethanopterin reductase-like flavin-dependent oxidoreductase (luciferase family)
MCNDGGLADSPVGFAPKLWYDTGRTSEARRPTSGLMPVWREPAAKGDASMADIQFGLMVRAQFPPGDDMHMRFRELVEQVRLADRLGFASLTNGMHYSSTPWQGFQQFPFLSRMMAEAPSMRLNFGLVLLALHKPLDIAEQIATIDVMSGGKVIFGAALGYREVEYLAFGTTQKARVKRFEENLAAVKRLWTEDVVDMAGSHFTLKGASAPTKPVQRPHPPIWIGANADPAIQRAARLGDCWYVNPHNRIDTIVRQVEVYKRALEVYGKPFPKEFPARREVFVARSRDEAIRLCAPFLGAKYQAYEQWGQSKVMPEGDNDLGVDFDELIKDRFLLGSPDEVAEQMLALHRATGINHLIMSVQWPGMPQSLVLDELHMLAEEVFPKVRQG